MKTSRRRNHEIKCIGLVYTRVTQVANRFHSGSPTKGFCIKKKFGSNEQKDARNCVRGHDDKEYVIIKI
jgi:hypothetical protein